MPHRGFVCGSVVKILPAMQETSVQSLIPEDPLEQEMVTHSRNLASEIPWTEEPDELQSLGSQELETIQQLHTHTTSTRTHDELTVKSILIFFFFPMPYLWHIYIFSVRDRKPLNFQSHIFKKIMKYHVISPLQRPSKMC